MNARLNETELYQAIWDRCRLILTDEDRARLKAATVSVNGLGGIGGIIVEELVRSGIGHLRLSDPDVFEPTNLGRQLYATTRTLGRNKAGVAKERVLEINPYCKVEAYIQGVQKENVFKILEGVDVVVDEVDIWSRSLVLHRAAKKTRVPLVHGARASFPGDRWTIQVNVWNYRDYPETKTREETNKLWTCNLTWDELTEDVLARVDQEISRSMKRRIREEIIRGNTSTFGNVPQEYLLSQLNGDLEEPYKDNLFHKRAIFVQIPNTVGILTSLEAVKLVLGWQTTTYKLNLLEGKVDYVTDVPTGHQLVAGSQRPGNA
jgi:molybdopterin/thiamine biosynthesis adenylyltransferase